MAWAPAPAAAQPRETVLVTGSSTVYPFSSAVAESMAEAAGGQRVKVASTGTVHGFAQFCRGPGLEHPDVQNASRRMTAGEFSLCVRNGVNEIMEVPIGFDGIVVAHRKGLPSPNFSLTQLWLGVAKEVPQNGRMVPNPYTSWRQVSADLPDWPIRVIGPPRTSGTRDSFTELAMMAGCRSAPEVVAISDTAERNRICTTVREDGRWVDAGEDDEAIVRRITTDADGTLGIFGFSFLDAARDRVEGSHIEGVDDTPETIASGRYPLSRPLFLYAKRPNLERIPALKDYLAEYVSDRALGSGGYLAQRGLVPLDAGRLREVQNVVRERTVMNRRPNG
ncbi:substrate-binding domain-containing protein [Roseomonas ludipueritiae]|uniref:Substrate-binding domain-containing protein n=1 Tax=Pseudoroseomonas ludipueritiae TaxID=198093 RepID=A0ABR7R2M5_9PROT|nr:substrate-binding domain-containing protein [Pseudoroseomonas ludipueritiae]